MKMRSETCHKKSLLSEFTAISIENQNYDGNSHISMILPAEVQQCRLHEVLPMSLNNDLHDNPPYENLFSFIFSAVKIKFSLSLKRGLPRL